jgi:glycosyltransferase involved in cell wall biosynthesis
VSPSRIIFVGPSPTGDPSRHPGGQLTAALGIAEYARARGVEIDPIDTSADGFSPAAWGTRLWLGVGRLFMLRKRLKGGSASAVLFFVGARLSFFERVLLALLARLAGVRTVFCIRDGSFVAWMRSSPVLHGLVAVLLRIPDYVVVQGTRSADMLAASGVPKRKLVIVHNWLSSSFEVANEPRLAETGRPVRLVFVGWLVQEKGVWELIDAFAELSKRYAVTLDIIGGGTLAAKVREGIAERHLHQCRVHGWMTPDGVRRMLDVSDVFVLPSYYEGFPNALLEAMARGLPAVCSDVGAVSDALWDGQSGFLVPPRSARAVAEAIERYLRNPRLISEHGGKALELVRLVHDRETNLAKLFRCLESE